MLPRCHSRWLCPSSLHAPILMHSPLLLLQPPSLLLSLTPNLSNLSPNPPSNATCSVVLFHAPHPFASSSIFTTSSSQATWKHFFKYTRPKPAYGRQGLDWIVGPGYSFVVFSINKTMETKKNHETALKNHGHQSKP